MAAREGGGLGIGEFKRKGQGSRLVATVEERNADRLGGETGGERERAAGGRVVGAGKGDLQSRQFWVEKDTLLFVREMEPARTDPKKVEDI